MRNFLWGMLCVYFYQLLSVPINSLPGGGAAVPAISTISVIIFCTTANASWLLLLLLLRVQAELVDLLLHALDRASSDQLRHRLQRDL